MQMVGWGTTDLKSLICLNCRMQFLSQKMRGGARLETEEEKKITQASFFQKYNRKLYITLSSLYYKKLREKMFLQ